MRFVTTAVCALFAMGCPAGVDPISVLDNCPVDARPDVDVRVELGTFATVGTYDRGFTPFASGDDVPRTRGGQGADMVVYGFEATAEGIDATSICVELRDHVTFSDTDRERTGTMWFERTDSGTFRSSESFYVLSDAGPIAGEPMTFEVELTGPFVGSTDATVRVGDLLY